MVIKNGLIFTPNQSFCQGSIIVADGIIKDVIYDANLNIPETENIIDASGCYVIPGLVDIHLHGCMGHDFCEGTREALDAICEYELSQGVTSICPTTMTIATSLLEKVLDNARSYDNSTGATIRGITMEGPFISKIKKGAQNEEYISKPDINLFRSLQNRCGGLIKQVAIAPEEDENFAFIKTISKDVVCSIAHSSSDYNTAMAAFDAGATHVTHLYNGMNSFSHRNPGIPGAAYDCKDNVFIELICDGVHIDPTIVRMTFDMFGSSRICMISDSMEATGLSNGSYKLGGQAVQVTGNRATLSDGTLAGSVSSLYQCLKTAVNSMNIPLEDAITSCTITPAKSIGIDAYCGSLEPNKLADILILDKSLNLGTVLLSRGASLWHEERHFDTRSAL